MSSCVLKLRHINMHKRKHNDFICLTYVDVLACCYLHQLSIHILITSSNLDVTSPLEGISKSDYSFKFCTVCDGNELSLTQNMNHFLHFSFCSIHGHLAMMVIHFINPNCSLFISSQEIGNPPVSVEKGTKTPQRRFLFW